MMEKLGFFTDEDPYPGEKPSFLLSCQYNNNLRRRKGVLRAYADEVNLCQCLKKYIQRVNVKLQS